MTTLDGADDADDADDAEDAEEAEDADEAVDADDQDLCNWLEFDILPTVPTRAGDVLTVAELFGRGILRSRLYFGWSQRELERRSGVDQSTICRLETGRRANVGSKRLCAILKALRVGDIVFQPRPPAAPPTALELMLHGDPWERATKEADRRVNRRRSA